MMKNVMISKELLERLSTPEKIEKLTSEELNDLILKLEKLLFLVRGKKEQDKRVLEEVKIEDERDKLPDDEELEENRQNRCFDCGFKIEDHQQVCEFCISNYN